MPSENGNLTLQQSRKTVQEHKTPTHTLIRVRNNQRRHRARRREYVASLEKKLEKTESMLAEARAEVEELKGLLANSKNDIRLGAAHVTASKRACLPPESIPNPKFSDSSAISVLPQTTSLSLLLAGRAESSSLTPGCCSPAAKPSATTVINTTTSNYLQRNNSQSDSCTKAAMEFTTLCANADVLIAQQNFRGLDELAVSKWLERGFQPANSQGGGCRVENMLLFELLDYISDV